jgi:16S rRNA G1207 methylase RsmC
MDLKEVALVDPISHWYYQSKLFALVRAVRKFSPEWVSLIDVGAGSGFFSRSIADFEKGQKVICVDPNYEAEKSEEAGNLKFVKVKVIKIFKISHFGKKKIKNIILYNLLQRMKILMHLKRF